VDSNAADGEALSGRIAEKSIALMSNSLVAIEVDPLFCYCAAKVVEYPHGSKMMQDIRANVAKAVRTVSCRAVAKADRRP